MATKTTGVRPKVGGQIHLEALAPKRQPKPAKPTETDKLVLHGPVQTDKPVHSIIAKWPLTKAQAFITAVHELYAALGRGYYDMTITIAKRSNRR